MKRFAFLILALPTLAMAGTYKITPTTKSSSGLNYSLGDNKLESATSNGKDYFKLKSGTPAGTELVISGLSIKQGFTWKNVTIDATASDFVEVTIRDSAGGVLLDTTNIQAVKSIDLSQTEAAKKGRSLTITVKFNSTNSRLCSIELTYVGTGVFAFPSPYLISDGNLNISYDLPNDGVVTLAIYDSRGRLVREIYNNQSLQARSSPKQADIWNGRNTRGNKVSSGLYLVYVNVKFLNRNNSDVGDYTSTFRFVVFR